MPNSLVQESVAHYGASKGKKPLYVSWSTFEKKYLSREDGYKYEWNNGRIDKTTNAMRPKQWFIFRNLQVFFQTIVPIPNGLLLQEADVFLSATMHKKPDITFATFEQIRLAEGDERVIPALVMEIISPTDSAYKVQEKTSEYLRSGVSMVWLIYPHTEEVCLYRADLSSSICREKAICSAQPIIPGFNISVEEIFRK